MKWSTTHLWGSLPGSFQPFPFLSFAITWNLLPQQIATAAQWEFWEIGLPGARRMEKQDWWEKLPFLCPWGRVKACIWLWWFLIFPFQSYVGMWSMFSWQRLKLWTPIYLNGRQPVVALTHGFSSFKWHHLIFSQGLVAKQGDIAVAREKQCICERLSAVLFKMFAQEWP